MDKEYTPFHKGELALQEKLGVREEVHTYAPRIIRPYMPDQHRDFYATLPQLFMGSVDENGRPWASVLFGEPGFISSPQPTVLTFSGLPDASDPLTNAIAAGSEVGMVGVEVETRRRNRVNGRVSATSLTGFEVTITQSFGNCPKYIQVRERTSGDMQKHSVGKAVTRKSLSTADRKLIENSDTFYIASASFNMGQDERHGADMSHRGGLPGFVRILDDGSLLFPDFAGNNIYNTLGNIGANPVAGLLFMDFETGDLLQLSGTAEIIWPNDTEFTYEGATKYVRIVPEAVIRRADAMPYVWESTERSPSLNNGTIWEKRQQAVVGKDGIAYQVSDIVPEADGINSLYLRPVVGTAPAYMPGQHLPVAFDIDGKKLRRTYTLSSAPKMGGALRLTIKANKDGYVSRYVAEGL
ncbi:MAG: pyridoxamine 5'-phosphate oxidase family protein, partial [Kordiimonadaceae bacterium]|nr:pyridoxamine 5'-phosphate oxidase family protein [Kordiimonadaceae bacterium]